MCSTGAEAPREDDGSAAKRNLPVISCSTPTRAGTTSSSSPKVSIGLVLMPPRRPAVAARAMMLHCAPCAQVCNTFRNRADRHAGQAGQ